MNIIPAIDLMNQQCVRLYKGDFQKSKTYRQEPLEMAKQFQKEGAKYLHIVDLNAAKEQKSQNLEVIEKIAKNTNLLIQTGGGIRSQEQIKNLFKLGIYKVVIGSLAVNKSNLVKEWIQYFGKEKIVLAFDIKIINEQATLLTSAWQQASSITLWKILEIYPADSQILCTDIDKDGTLKSPNFSLYKKILQDFPNIVLQASGGISKIDDIIHLKKENIPYAIIGKALYEERFTLKEAISQC